MPPGMWQTREASKGKGKEGRSAVTKDIQEMRGYTAYVGDGAGLASQASGPGEAGGRVWLV